MEPPQTYTESLESLIRTSFAALGMHTDTVALLLTQLRSEAPPEPDYLSVIKHLLQGDMPREGCWCSLGGMRGFALTPQEKAALDAVHNEAAR